MTLNDFITEQKHQLTVFRMLGKQKSVGNFLKMMVETDSHTTDKEWWTLRYVQQMN